jgi:DNA-binding MarR family transcriptional regulator
VIRPGLARLTTDGRCAGTTFPGGRIGNPLHGVVRVRYWGRKKVHVNTAHWTTSRLLSTAARLNNHNADVRLTEMGITQSSATTLSALATSGPINQTHLADLVRVQGQTMSRVLDGLELKGLVRRLQDAGDGRANRICITPRGKVLLSRIDTMTRSAPASAGLDSGALRDQLMRIITGLSPKD